LIDVSNNAAARRVVAQFAFQPPNIFGSVGLHSTAETYGKQESFAVWLSEILSQSMPNLYLDIGRDDDRLGLHEFFCNFLTSVGCRILILFGQGGATPRWYALMLSG
jgi:hypothetical protein